MQGVGMLSIEKREYLTKFGVEYKKIFLIQFCPRSYRGFKTLLTSDSFSLFLIICFVFDAFLIVLKKSRNFVLIRNYCSLRMKLISLFLFQILAQIYFLFLLSYTVVSSYSGVYCSDPLQGEVELYTQLGFIVQSISADL